MTEGFEGNEHCWRSMAELIFFQNDSMRRGLLFAKGASRALIVSLTISGFSTVNWFGSEFVKSKSWYVVLSVEIKYEINRTVLNSWRLPSGTWTH